MAHVTARALIFDMDGLMIDSEPLWWKIEYAITAAYGCRWSDALALSCLGGGLEAAALTMRREVGLPLEAADAVQEMLARFTARVDELTLKEGCLELLDAARRAGVPLAVASSSPAELIALVLRQFALTDRFAVVVSGLSVAHPKPAPDVFLHAARLLGVAARDCVVLEDSKAGTQAGVAAGATVFAVPEHDAAVFRSWTPHVLRDLHQARTLLNW